MLYRTRIGLLLLLSALSAHMVPACGRSYRPGPERDADSATAATDRASSSLAALHGGLSHASASCLSTTAGSIRIACTAGPMAAASATAAMNPATRMIVNQSVGAIP
jgi:hypothetical protein